MSRKKHAGLRAASAAVCLTILAAATTANWAPLSNANLPVSAKTLAELQDERKSNEDKIAEKQKQLDSLQDDLKQKEEYQKTLQEKITLQQENLDLKEQPQSQFLLVVLLCVSVFYAGKTYLTEQPVLGILYWVSFLMVILHILLRAIMESRDISHRSG